MSDYRVRWANGNAEVEVDLIDKIGWTNTYQFSDPDAMIPSSGDATNQVDMVPVTGDWVMYGFDNSQNYPTDGTAKGKGIVKDIALGEFPKGEFEWVVIKKL